MLVVRHTLGSLATRNTSRSHRAESYRTRFLRQSPPRKSLGKPISTRLYRRIAISEAHLFDAEVRCPSLVVAPHQGRTPPTGHNVAVIMTERSRRTTGNRSQRCKAIRLRLLQIDCLSGTALPLVSPASKGQCIANVTTNDNNHVEARCRTERRASRLIMPVMAC